MVTRWRMQALVPCFDKWRTVAQESKQRKSELLERTSRRLLNGTCGGTLALTDCLSCFRT